jgi:tetratricopeptide (TPR) repeat protein
MRPSRLLTAVPGLAALGLAAAVLPACGGESGPTERERARADALYEEALDTVDEGRNLDAIAFLNDALASDPDHEPSHRLRSAMGERVSHFDEVIESAEWLIARDPDGPETGELLTRIVRSSLNDGRIDTARRALVRMEKVEPDSARTAVLWARMHLENGDMVKAKRNAKRSVRLEPAQTIGHHIVGVVLEEEGALEEAILSFRRVLEVDPGHLGARDHLATLLLRSDRTKEARKHRKIHTAIIRATPGGFRHFPPTKRLVAFTDVVELLPEWPKAHMELARALLELNRLEEARESAEAALALDPRNPKAHELLAGILRRLGDEEGARRHEGRDGSGTDTQ